MAGQENNAENNQQQEPQQQQQSSDVAAAAPAAQECPAASASQTARSQRVAATVHKIDYEKDVVYLYQFCRSPCAPSISPFCLKVETWLRIAGVKYQNVDHKLKYKSKKGQLPFVELNGAEIADSSIIIRDLSKHFNVDLDAHLSRDQQILSHAFISMLENHTSWVYRWWRYTNAGEFVKEAKLNLQQAMQTKIPSPILNFVMKMKIKGKKKTAVGHGIGVHKPDEIYEFGKQDLEILNEYLDEKQYFFGDQPSLLDCVTFSHLIQFLHGQGDTFPMKVFLEEKCSRLMALVGRIKERFWPDWDEICTTLDLNTHLPKPAPTKTDDDEKKEEDKEKDKEKDEDGEKDKVDDAEKELKKEGIKQDENKLEEQTKGDKDGKEEK